MRVQPDLHCVVSCPVQQAWHLHAFRLADRKPFMAHSRQACNRSLDRLAAPPSPVSDRDNFPQAS